MKLFKTSIMEIVNYYQTLFGCEFTKYLVETTISEIHCCVVTLCLTCFYV